MIAPSIERAKAAQRACQGEVALVLVLDSSTGQIGWSSYGKDVNLCMVGRALGAVAEAAVVTFLECMAEVREARDKAESGKQKAETPAEEPHVI